MRLLADENFPGDTARELGESYIKHIGPERVAANYPGTTREEIVPRLEAKGLKCGNRVVPGVN